MIDSLVQDYLAKSAREHPANIAISDGTDSFSFKELDQLSDQLAGLLETIGVARGDCVIYYMKRHPKCLLATMAILKSGGAYIPLDTNTPLERLSQIFHDLNSKAILCDNSTLAKASKLRSELDNSDLPLISLDDYAHQGKYGENVCYWEDILSTQPVALNSKGDPDDVAYVLFTSGSTGTPKGVMITHRNIINYIDWAVSYFDITADDQILGTAPFYFDMSTFDIFCAIAAGAPLHLATGSKLLFPEHLARFIEEKKITIWKGVSSLLMFMCRAKVVAAGRMESLREVIFAGEPLAAQHLTAWMQAFQQVKFYNGYGPTEATGVSLCHHVQHIPEPGQKIPIGIPCKGAKVVLLDEDDNPVSPGEIGELCISGECLAKGYMNDPEKTNRLFTPPPPGLDIGDRMYRTGDLVQQNPTGDFVFISRKDQQVKWMGYRIELGEIETKILGHPEVTDTAVLLVEDEKTNLSQLVAFYESPDAIPFRMMRRHLTKTLPNYMVPKNFIYLEKLPRNERGKISRKDILNWYQKEVRETNANI